MTNFLTIDAGTMSIRAIIYTPQGKILHEAAYEYSANFRPPGLVEQNPSDWRIGLLTILSSAGSYVFEHKLELAAIAVTSQRASVIPVDSTGYPLHHAVTWQDKRSLPQTQQLVDALTFEGLYRKTGLRPNPYFSAPKMMWFAQQEPGIYRDAAKLIGVQDYLIYLLTGHFVTDWTQAARTMLMDINTFSWAPELLEASGVDVNKLADLVPPGTSVEGGLRRSIAKSVNLPEGLPVIIGGGDQQCAALALNVLAAGQAEANTGTGSFAIAHADAPVHHPEQRVLCSASAIPGKWITEAGIFNSGAILRWFRELLGGESATSYPELDKAASSSPVGANGVVMLPHFEGSAAPNWNSLAKGVFFNLSIGTTRGDMARAILEGVALELTENLRLMEGLIGRIDTLSVAGGMARSDTFNQIQADALHRNVVRHENAEASSLGAVMSAMVTLGQVDSYEAAFAEVAPQESVTYAPDPEAHVIYEQVTERRRTLYRVLDEQGIYETFSAALGA
ncbi:MAG: FGGY-family carbohydrate kinase [Propioniciclava sp.]|uniref:FGGY-family carbohydrate kinase n=1 Tax=Propioniciclava sp. TaxID=2038686 RepID=UPI0039E22485